MYGGDSEEWQRVGKQKETEKTEIKEAGKEGKLSSSELAEEIEKEEVQTKQQEEKRRLKKKEEMLTYMLSHPTFIGCDRR